MVFPPLAEEMLSFKSRLFLTKQKRAFLNRKEEKKLSQLMKIGNLDGKRSLRRKKRRRKEIPLTHRESSNDFSLSLLFSTSGHIKMGMKLELAFYSGHIHHIHLAKRERLQPESR